MIQKLYSVTATVAGSDLAPMVFVVSAPDEGSAATGAIDYALDKGVDEALLEIASFEILDISQFARGFVEEFPEPYEPTLFEKCVEAAEGEDDLTRRVIQTIIDNTGSPYTVDELTRILSEVA